MRLYILNVSAQFRRDLARFPHSGKRKRLSFYFKSCGRIFFGRARRKVIRKLATDSRGKWHFAPDKNSRRFIVRNSGKGRYRIFCLRRAPSSPYEKNAICRFYAGF
ncbi:MAG: hypothetical protein DBX55_09235 [Verrucomicrobia bacterium]|nr:MAG: hypothetical protein DBX55_09235 [Verrucomicrobiota bacterium]